MESAFEHEKQDRLSEEKHREDVKIYFEYSGSPQVKLVRGKSIYTVFIQDRVVPRPSLSKKNIFMKKSISQ